VLKVLNNAKGCIAADLTAFDRFMLRDMIDPFFLMYMQHCVPGTPSTILVWLSYMASQGALVMSDGVVYERDRGNPSGFMQTIRLNCVVHLACLCYAVMRLKGWDDPRQVALYLLDHCMIQMCGDDSRFFAMTDDSVGMFDLRNGGEAYLRVWREELPWEVKIEGLALFHGGIDERCQQCPPMISRGFVHMFGLVFEPLYNISRVLKRLSANENRERGLEKALVESAKSTLALQIVWQSRGWFFSPALQYFLREYAQSGNEIKTAHTVSSDLYSHAPVQHWPGPKDRPVRMWS